MMGAAVKSARHDIIRPFDGVDLPSEVDAVFHLASPASPADFTRMPLEIAIINSRGTQNMLDRMQTRKELYDLIGYYDYEALDASITASVPPEPKS